MTLFAAGTEADPLVVIELEAEDAEAATGVMAERLTAAFAAARDRGAKLGPNGCVIFAVRGGAAIRAASSALARTLALEWGPRGIRVNAVCGEHPETLIRFIASPASRMLTGAVLDA